MRRSDRTRARSSGRLIGFVRKSSAPASSPLIRSGTGSSGHHHHRHDAVRLVGPDPLAHLVAAHPGHDHVEEHQVRPVRLDPHEGLRAGRRGHHRIAHRQEVGEELDILRGVIDDQDPRRRHQLAGIASTSATAWTKPFTSIGFDW